MTMGLVLCLRRTVGSPTKLSVYVRSALYPTFLCVSPYISARLFVLPRIPVQNKIPSRDEDFPAARFRPQAMIIAPDAS